MLSTTKEGLNLAISDDRLLNTLPPIPSFLTSLVGVKMGMGASGDNLLTLP
jgi:hypothetical protein